MKIYLDEKEFQNDYIFSLITIQTNSPRHGYFFPLIFRYYLKYIFISSLKLLKKY